jgi:hypothetical protein
LRTVAQRAELRLRGWRLADVTTQKTILIDAERCAIRTAWTGGEPTAWISTGAFDRSGSIHLWEGASGTS